MALEENKIGLFASAALGLLWLYQRTLSPVLYALGVRCRHYPTCSSYSMEAFRRHDPWRAFWLTASRLLRCHPLGSHGIDLVPAERNGRWWQVWKLGDWAWTERRS